MQQIRQDAGDRHICESSYSAHSTLYSKLMRELRIELDAAERYVLREAYSQLSEHACGAEGCKEGAFDSTLLAN